MMDATAQARPPALEVEAISHHYGTRVALRDVSLRVAPGRFAALLGLNGAGKTTLLSLITRLFDTQAGSIRVFGMPLRQSPSLALRRMGVVFQARTLDLDLSVRDNLHYAAALHGLPSRQADESIRAALMAVGLSDRAADRARTLSGGQMRRVEIARAWLHQPRLMILDEPTAGLDTASRASLLAQSRALVRDHGVAMLWATHLLDEVAPQDDVVVLHNGRVLAKGMCSDVIALASAADLREAFARLTGGVPADEAA
jgi:ABC-2 type transport system ATP-binding protein